MIIDLFAGAGGWEVGLERSGVDEEIIGIDINRSACLTAEAAGYERICKDINQVNPEQFSKVTTIIGSPPCQSFSLSGKMLGFGDPKGELTRIPYQWISELKPERVLLEQVPDVSFYWRQLAKILREELGYYTIVKTVDSSLHGVPQSRLRAILLAAKHPIELNESDKSMTMLDAFPSYLDYKMISDANGGKLDANGKRMRGERKITQPSFTLTGKCLNYKFKHQNSEARKLTIQEASVLQTFPQDYLWKGGKIEIGQQIGNAIPPNLAKSLYNSVTTIKER